MLDGNGPMGFGSCGAYFWLAKAAKVKLNRKTCWGFFAKDPSPYLLKVFFQIIGKSETQPNFYFYFCASEYIFHPNFCIIYEVGLAINGLFG
jgi:hypothetical protein